MAGDQDHSDEAALDAILDLVRSRTGLDFSRYRRNTIGRRVRNRMLSVKVATLPAYRDYLSSIPEETPLLIDRLAIKVSRFYRNATAFDIVRASILPALARAANGRALRIWSAGSGLGEEAHTLALLMEEQGIPGTVTATDLDANALQAGAAGCYPLAAFAELPTALRDRFFAPARGKALAWRACDAVRSRIRWVHHDLTRGRLGMQPCDLVSCRNLVIYLDRAAQERAFTHLVSAVGPGGYLFLGEAEWPPQQLLGGLQLVDRRARLFHAASAQALAA